MSGQEIARRLEVSDTMISRLVGAGRRMPEPVQGELPDLDPGPDSGMSELVGAEQSELVAEPVVPEPEPVVPEPVVPEPAVPEPAVPEPVVPEPAVAGLVVAEPVVPEHNGVPAGPAVGLSAVGSARLAEASVSSRYAGAMLLHGFFDRVGMEAVFAPLAGARAGSGTVPSRSRRFDDLALLTATTAAFALGVGSVEASTQTRTTPLGAPSPQLTPSQTRSEHTRSVPERAQVMEDAWRGEPVGHGRRLILMTSARRAAASPTFAAGH